MQPGAPITHQDTLFTTGSCFADLLGAKLKESRFQVAINPFGVSYNPLSVHRALAMALRKERPAPELYVQSEGSFRHLDFHSAFCAKTLNQLAASLQQSISEAGMQLQRTNVLSITYGTSWVYRHKDSGKTVSNCQKLPAREFEKLLLDPSDIITSFESLYHILRETLPSVRIILTVSPVRHLRDSLDLNQLSKAGLIVACHKLTRRFENVEYFPAYEIMMDDLRDYRFYDQDMIHPSPAAVDYIWEKFGERYFSADTEKLAAKCRDLTRALSHRPFDASSNDYRGFLEKTLALAKEVGSSTNVADDIRDIESRLNSFAQLR